jgi:hypothetical protein
MNHFSWFVMLRCMWGNRLKHRPGGPNALGCSHFYNLVSCFECFVMSHPSQRDMDPPTKPGASLWGEDVHGMRHTRDGPYCDWWLMLFLFWWPFLLNYQPLVNLDLWLADHIYGQMFSANQRRGFRRVIFRLRPSQFEGDTFWAFSMPHLLCRFIKKTMIISIGDPLYEWIPLLPSSKPFWTNKHIRHINI